MRIYIISLLISILISYGFRMVAYGCLKSNLAGISLNLQDLGCRLQGAVMRCSIFLAVQICSDFLLNRDNVK